LVITTNLYELEHLTFRDVNRELDPRSSFALRAGVVVGDYVLALQ
jgi:hypothetical protein